MACSTCRLQVICNQKWGLYIGISRRQRTWAGSLRVNNRKNVHNTNLFTHSLPNSQTHTVTRPKKKRMNYFKPDALNVFRLQCDQISMQSLKGKMHQPLNKCTVAYCISMHKIWAIKMPEHLATLVDGFFFFALFACHTHSLKWNIFAMNFVLFFVYHFLVYTSVSRVELKIISQLSVKKMALQKSLLRSIKRWFWCKIQQIIASFVAIFFRIYWNLCENETNKIFVKATICGKWIVFGKMMHMKYSVVY